MNNIDRITEEIQEEAKALAPTVGMSVDRFVEVVLEIVNAEDEHRIARTNIRQLVESIIQKAAVHGHD